MGRKFLAEVEIDEYYHVEIKKLSKSEYISKDKIRAKIKELEEQKKHQEKVGLKYSEAGFFQGKINVLQELLEKAD